MTLLKQQDILPAGSMPSDVIRRTVEAISVRLIDPDPAQVRKHFDPVRLDELASSMRAYGLAVPVSLRPVGDRFVLVHGERRWRAARTLGWETIPATILDIDVASARWLALVENIQRADLTPMEEAEALEAIISDGMTQAELGRRLGKSQSYVAQKIRLLTLPKSIRIFLAQGAISEGHARLLLRFRTFYGAQTIEFPPDVERGVDWDKPAHVAMAYSALRPLDAPCWMPGASERITILLRDATRSFIAEIQEQGGSIPTWTIAAFWFAAMVADCGFSVVKLAGLIDGWESLILSAVAHLNIGVHPVPAGLEAEGRRQAFLEEAYWGHRADLRHARLGHWAESPPDHIVIKAGEMALNRGLGWPSAMAVRNRAGERSMSHDMAEGPWGEATNHDQTP